MAAASGSCGPVALCALCARRWRWRSPGRAPPARHRPAPRLGRRDSRCPTLAVTGETQCAKHLGWPHFPGHTGPCGRPVISEGLCPRCGGPVPPLPHRLPSRPRPHPGRIPHGPHRRRGRPGRPHLRPGGGRRPPGAGPRGPYRSYEAAAHQEAAARAEQHRQEQARTARQQAEDDETARIRAELAARAPPRVHGFIMRRRPHVLEEALLHGPEARALVGGVAQRVVLTRTGSPCRLWSAPEFPVVTTRTSSSAALACSGGGWVVGAVVVLGTGERGPGGGHQGVRRAERPFPRFLERSRAVGGPHVVDSLHQNCAAPASSGSTRRTRRSGAVTADRVTWLSERAALQSPPANRISPRTAIARR